MRRLLFAVAAALLLLSVPADAQTAAASYDLIIYVPASPISQTRNVLASAVQCDQPTPTGTNINPNTWFWSDPARAGRFCRTDDTARLDALADGSYNGTVTPIAADGTRGVESASVPFLRSRNKPPAAVTGVLIIRSGS